MLTTLYNWFTIRVKDVEVNIYYYLVFVVDKNDYRYPVSYKVINWSLSYVYNCTGD